MKTNFLQILEFFSILSQVYQSIICELFIFDYNFLYFRKYVDFLNQIIKIVLGHVDDF